MLSTNSTQKKKKVYNQSYQIHGTESGYFSMKNCIQKATKMPKIYGIKIEKLYFGMKMFLKKGDNPSCAIENVKTVGDFIFYKFKFLSLG
jgi:hypothetical protein